VDPGRDSLLAVYEGECCDADGMQPLTLREIGCDDDSCGFSQFLSKFCVDGLTPGNTYFIQICNWDEDVDGIYDLRINCPCSGACCATDTGVCTPGVAPATCEDENESFALLEDCTFFDPPCGFGACCDGETCTDGTIMACCGSLDPDDCPAGVNFFAGAECNNIVCNPLDNCSFNSTASFDTPGVLSSGFRSQLDLSAAVPNILARADNFTMKGSGENLCQIDTIEFRVFHTNHDTEAGCDQGGGGICADNAADYDGIHVMIAPDDPNATPGKGPVCEPNAGPVDGTWTCGDGRIAGDNIPDVEPDGWHFRLDADDLTGPGGDPPAPSGDPDTWEFTSVCPGGQCEDFITLKFDPPIEIAKNKKHWISIVVEVPQASHYGTIWFLADEWNGNPTQAWLSTGEQEWEQIDPAVIAQNLAYRLNGTKQGGCGGCRLYGDVAPPFCVVDIDDVLAGLAAFADPDPCVNFPDFDIAPCGGNCAGGGSVDIDEVLAILGGFAGNFACDHPCPPGPCCIAGVCSGDADGSGNLDLSKEDCQGMGGTWSGSDTCPMTESCPTCVHNGACP
jgi:hypothetical protein